MNDFALRPVTPGDGPALAALLAASADGGRFALSSRFVVEPWTALCALHGDFDGVVAEAGDGLAGAGLVRYRPGWFEGAVRPTALLNTLVVHPAHRRRGLAGRLAAWRIEHARNRMGEDGVLYAGIQAGNAASVRTAARWRTQVLARVIGVIPTPPRGRPPSRPPGVRVRLATDADWGAFADGHAASYDGFTFRPREDAAALRAWHAETPFDTPYRAAFVAQSAAGDLLAGASLTESARIRTTRMVRMPATMRLLNRVIRLVPADGLMREVSVSRFWFRAGQEAAARLLWDTVRWEWRDRGSTFMLWGDPRSALARLFKPAPWMPHSTGTIVLAGPVDADPARPVYSL